MTTPTWIPGYMAAIEIDTNDLTVVGNVLSIDISKVVNPKPVFGQKWRNSASGQLSGTISAGGHQSVEIIPLFLPMMEKETPLAFTIYVGDEAGTIDAGEYAGNLILSSYQTGDDAEGEWDWTLEGELDGPITFTPFVP